MNKWFTNNEIVLDTSLSAIRFIKSLQSSSSNSSWSINFRSNSECLAPGMKKPVKFSQTWTLRVSWVVSGAVVSAFELGLYQLGPVLPLVVCKGSFSSPSGLLGPENYHIFSLPCSNGRSNLKPFIESPLILNELQSRVDSNVKISKHRGTNHYSKF